MITQDELKSRLRYDPETGIFTWLNGCKGTHKGAVAGCMSYGRTVIRFNQRNYMAHRLAWLYMTGNWPKDQIDHINGEPSDNRFANLRDVSDQINKQNKRKPQAGNKLGVLGVKKVKDRYYARIKVDGIEHGLGAYGSAEDANNAYMAAKIRMHPGFVQA